jgi:hypothetical protein
MVISVGLFVLGWALGIFEVFLIFYSLELPGRSQRDEGGASP